MPIAIDARIEYDFADPTDFLLQMEAAAIPEQMLADATLETSTVEHMARVPAQDSIGERIWLRCQGRFSAHYRAKVTVQRQLADVATLPQVPPHLLPGETVQYMMDSRFCPAGRFQSFVQAEFGELSGGARISAMRQWIADNFTYAAGSSIATTTSLDSFVERRGVCRDYAHVMCSLARASAIPARYVSCFAPGVDPQDFHAVAEVFLSDGPDALPGSGSWHIVDATDMANPSDAVKIAVGRDAVDVSFLTSYGTASMVDKQISVTAADSPVG